MQVLEEDGQMVVSTLEELGHGGGVADAHTVYSVALKRSAFISLAFKHVVWLVESLVTASSEERSERLAKVDMLVAMAMEQLAAFKQGLSSSYVELFTGLANQSRAQLRKAHQGGAQPAIWRALVDSGASVAEKTADAFLALLEGTHEIAAALLKSGPE